MIGQRLGSYKILAKLGEGGMGEVYRARDSRLSREVALKTLPEAFASDPARRTRFEREARLLASLNHPHIGAIYGFEKDGDTRFLVLELVEGPTLADLISGSTSGRRRRVIGRPSRDGAMGPVKDRRSGPGAGLPVAEAIAIALQIAEALEAAHEAGVIHRDLKPANIKLTADGAVKVLDFGLAKALLASSVSGTGEAPALTNSPTLSAPNTPAMTETGMIMGTAAYMSPEQAVGATLDKRTDIWSFGAVLYEMLTGRRAFPGQTAGDSLTAVQQRNPDFEALPAATPPRVVELVRRCLVKDPRERLRDIGDARIELREAVAGETEPIQSTDRSRRFTGLLWAAATLTVLAAVWMALNWKGEQLAPSTPTHLVVSLPRGQEGIDSVASSPVLISPDGRTLVYATRTEDGRHLYRRSLDTFDSERIPDTEGAESPFLSFDGEWVGFRAGGQLKKVRLSGGEAIPITPAPVLLLGASWGPDDTIVFADGDSTGLWQVSADGGTREALTAPSVVRAGGHRFPHQLPGGQGTLFGIGGVFGRPSELAFLPAGSGQWRTLHTASSRFSAIRYLPTGHLVYGQEGTIFAAAFDPDRQELTTEPRPIVPNVASSPTSQYVSFAVSDNGTLVYVPASAALSSAQLVWIEPAAKRGPGGIAETTVETIAEIPGATSRGRARMSPAGDRVAVSARTGGVADIWTYGLERGDVRRVTQGAEASRFVWTPDGQSMTVSMSGDLYTVNADGAGSPELFLEREGEQTPLSWSGDGRLLLFRERRPGTGLDLLIVSAADGRVAPLFESAANESDGVLSADGRWVAYVSDETGRPEVYLAPTEGPGERQTVSVDGGDTPRWSAAGTELFYLHGEKLMGVAVEGTPFRLGEARLLAAAPEGVSFNVGYGVVSDDAAVVGVRNPAGAGEPTELRVVLDWFEVLKASVPTGG